MKGFSALPAADPVIPSVRNVITTKLFISRDKKPLFSKEEPCPSSRHII